MNADKVATAINHARERVVAQTAERLKAHVRECSDCRSAIAFYKRMQTDRDFWLCREARDILMDLFS